MGAAEVPLVDYISTAEKSVSYDIRKNGRSARADARAGAESGNLCHALACTLMALSRHVTECHQRSNQLQASRCRYQTHRSAHGMCSGPSPPHGGGGLDVMTDNASRDRVTCTKVSDIERCFPGVAYERSQGCRVRFDRVASFMVHPSPPGCGVDIRDAAAGCVNINLIQHFFDRKVSECSRRWFGTSRLRIGGTISCRF